MAKQRETRRQHRIRKALEREVGGYWYKQHGGPFTPAGLPDLIGCVARLFIGIEVKEPDSDEPEGSNIQQYTAQQILEAGNGSVLLGCQTPEEAIDFVRKVMANELKGCVQNRTGDYNSNPTLGTTRSPPKRRRRVRSK